MFCMSQNTMRRFKQELTDLIEILIIGAIYLIVMLIIFLTPIRPRNSTCRAGKQDKYDTSTTQS